MPTLYVLGGANGVGKTTWYQTGIENKSIDGQLPFINTDTIVLKELGGYTPENVARGEEIARERITSLIKERKDFMIESNLSKSSDYEWIELMRKNGYDTVLYFLGNNDVETNKIRVQARVSEGGHDIAEPIIEHRYLQGLSYLKTKILSFTEATLIDSSTIPRPIAVLREGKIFSKEHDCPEWVQKSIEIAERLQQKLQLSEEQELKLTQKRPAQDLTEEFKEKYQRLKNRDRGLGM